MSGLFNNYIEEVSNDVQDFIKRHFWYTLQFSFIFPGCNGSMRKLSQMQLLFYSFAYMYHLPLAILGFRPMLETEPCQLTKLVNNTLVNILALSFSTILYRKKSLLIQIFQAMYSGMFNYGGWGERELKQTRKKYKTYVIYIAFYTCIAGTIGFFLIHWNWTTNNDEPLSGVINNLHFGLLSQTYYPYSDTDGFLFYFSLFVQYSIAVISMFSIGTTVYLFIFIFTELCVNIEHLANSISNIDNRVAIKSGNPNPYDICITENIRHHHNIITYFNLVEEIFSVVISATFFVGICTIALLGLDILMGAQKIQAFIAIAVTCAAEIGVLAIICWYGQKIQDLSESIGESLYFTNWVDNDKPYKTMGHIIMATRMIPLQLVAVFYKINMKTLTVVVNTAFFYFIVLNQLKNNEKIAKMINL